MTSTNNGHPTRTPMLGCIADDVTGATDLAVNLMNGGMSVVQLLGIPTARDLEAVDADAIVVALKSRSIPKLEAVRQSVESLRVFREFGIPRVFFKYCSTFDSTAEGNIGPVAEALFEALDARQTIFCPALPRNGRTVYQGHLFVHGKLLNESGMESHPLNPMKDANVLRVLEAQCHRGVGLLGFEDVHAQGVNERLEELAEQGIPFVVADACCDDHLQTLAEAVADFSLITGGSGIARFLPAVYRETGLLQSERFEARPPKVPGRAWILSGSCSTMTNKQVAWMQDKIPCRSLEIGRAIHDKNATIREIIDWAQTIDPNNPGLVYSTASPSQVTAIQQEFGAQVAAQVVEDCLAEAARLLVAECKVTRLVVAGGETSGAVIKKLGVRSLRIGPEISAGVPWTESLGNQPLLLALKSGNFGEENFFEKALSMLS